MTTRCFNSTRNSCPALKGLCMNIDKKQLMTFNGPHRSTSRKQNAHHHTVIHSLMNATNSSVPCRYDSTSTWFVYLELLEASKQIEHQDAPCGSPKGGLSRETRKMQELFSNDRNGRHRKEVLWDVSYRNGNERFLNSRGECQSLKVCCEACWIVSSLGSDYIRV